LLYPFCNLVGKKGKFEIVHRFLIRREKMSYGDDNLILKGGGLANFQRPEFFSGNIIYFEVERG